MRRFYAFLIMVFSLIAVVLFNVQGQNELFNHGLEYSLGTEITYVITPNDENKDFDIQDVAKEFTNRLEAAGAKDYYVYAQDDEYVANQSNGVPTYQITIRLSGLETEQEDVLRSVENYGKFWVTTQDNKRTDEGEDIVRGTAKIEYDYDKASVIVEMTDKFKDDVGSKLTVAETPEDGEEPTGGDNLIIWSDYIDETDSYEEANKNETVEQKKMQEKILAVLPASAFNKEDNTLTISTIGYVASGTSTQQLYASSAESVKRILNSDILDYKIERLHVDLLEPQYGNNSALLLSLSIVALVIVASIVLIACYGINGVAGATSLIVSVFLTICLNNFFGLSITPAFALSMIAIVAVGLVILTAYFSRFKNELYKGRTPAKANKESFRASISTALDATVFTLITTVILALLSKNSIQNFSLVLIMGVIFDVLICLFVTRIMLYFIANSKLSEKKGIFRVKTNLIPNISKDESQTYFGSHENFDSTKHKKKSLIACAILAVVSIVSVTLFSVLPSSSTFAFNNEFDSYTMVQIVDTHGDEHFKNNEDVNKFFEETINIKPFEVNISSIKDPNDLEGEQNVYYVNAKFNVSIEEIDAHVEAINEKLMGEGYDLELTTSKEENVTNDAINYFVVTPQATTRNFNNAILLIGISALCTIVYCFIRFRYTFALSSIITTVSTVLITTGILSLSRIPVSPNLGIALLAAVLITTLLEFIVLVRFGQLKSEMKNKVNSLEDYMNFASTALKRSITSLLVVYGSSMLGALLMILISPKQMFSLYFVMMIGATLGLLSILFLFVPVYNFSEKHLRIKFKKKEKKEKNKKSEKIKRTSREVEEVIIPGIND